jgi:hypothetical protein
MVTLRSSELGTGTGAGLARKRLLERSVRACRNDVVGKEAQRANARPIA